MTDSPTANPDSLAALANLPSNSSSTSQPGHLGKGDQQHQQDDSPGDGRRASSQLSSLQSSTSDSRDTGNTCTTKEAARLARLSPREKLANALQLYGMSDIETFWDPKLDTRAVMGWSRDMVVLSFRGTSSVRNALSDLRVSWQGRSGEQCLGVLPCHDIALKISQHCELHRMRGCLSICRATDASCRNLHKLGPAIICAIASMKPSLSGPSRCGRWSTLSYMRQCIWDCTLECTQVSCPALTKLCQQAVQPKIRHSAKYNKPP